jgi:nitroreductase
MKLLDAITNRHSDRSYKAIPVARDQIQLCLEAGRLAPSACNAQPWKFIVVDNQELKTEIAACSASLGMNKFLNQAPVIIVIVLEKANATSFIGGLVKGKDYTVMDIGIAVENICLQATELGLGTCIVGWFNEKKIKQLLHIPTSRKVPLMISLGYSDSEKRAKIRKNTAEICSYNRY